MSQGPLRKDTSPAELARALEADLSRLAEGHVDGSSRYRAWLRALVAHAWREVGQGHLSAPGQVEALLAGCDAALGSPDLGTLSPIQAASLELGALRESLRVADHVLRERATELRVSNPDLSELEQQILLTLQDTGGEYLRRGQVHERLLATFGGKRTPEHVGQKLDELYDAELLRCVRRKAQGNSLAAFYTLSAAGQRVVNGLSRERLLARWDPWLSATPSHVERTAQRGLSRGLTLFAPAGWSDLGPHAAWLSIALERELVDDDPVWSPAPKSPACRVLLVDLDPDRPAFSATSELGAHASILALYQDWASRPHSGREAMLAQTIATPESSRVKYPFPQEAPGLGYLPLSWPSDSVASLRVACDDTARNICHNYTVNADVDRVGQSFIGQLWECLCRWDFVIVRAPPGPADSLLFMALALGPRPLHCFAELQGAKSSQALVEQVRKRFVPQSMTMGKEGTGFSLLGTLPSGNFNLQDALNYRWGMLHRFMELAPTSYRGPSEKGELSSFNIEAGVPVSVIEQLQSYGRSSTPLLRAMNVTKATRRKGSFEPSSVGHSRGAHLYSASGHYHQCFTRDGTTQTSPLLPAMSDLGCEASQQQSAPLAGGVAIPGNQAVIMNIMLQRLVKNSFMSKNPQRT